ncbi:MAG: histidinol-phosphate transaminase [Syntrophales bacterium]|nr:histidinol-phosphate transaminase [Syntrophales bacterium]
MDVEKIIRAEVREQKGYSTEAGVFPIKLDANECPYGLTVEIQSRLLEKLREISLNRYPEAGSCALRSAFADHFGVLPEQVMIGNGSDELIYILSTATATANVSTLIPVPTFSMYKLIARNNGHRVLEVPLNEDYDLDLHRMLNCIRKEHPSVIFLSYPNNPTGNSFSEEKIRLILEESDGLVVVDEAYYPFSGKSFVPLLSKYRNLVVLRSLSKLGLAAARLGFLIAREELIEQLDKVRLPYNVNVLSQAVATLYLEEESYFRGIVQQVVKNREVLLAALRNIDGVRPIPSDANFILFSCNFDANYVYSYLQSKGILIKNLSAPGVLNNCMRVTVGRPEENEEFIKALKEALKE